MAVEKNENKDSRSTMYAARYFEDEKSADEFANIVDGIVSVDWLGGKTVRYAPIDIENSTMSMRELKERYLDEVMTIDKERRLAYADRRKDTSPNSIDDIVSDSEVLKYFKEEQFKGIVLLNKPEQKQEQTVLTLYHGTIAKEEFEKFKPDYRGAVWTDTNVDFARRYAGDGAFENSKILTVKATLDNPKHVTYGYNENWDIDQTVFKAKSEEYDSVIIDFKFMLAEHSYYKFILKNSPDSSIDCLKTIGSSFPSPMNQMSISEFDNLYREKDFLIHSYVAVFDTNKLEVIDRTNLEQERTENFMAVEKNENEKSTITLAQDAYLASTEEGEKDIDPSTVNLDLNLGEKPELLQEKETISITTAKGLVSEPLQGKDGNKYRRVSIPNKDENDKSPWSTFVVKSDKVHENEKSVTIDLPKDGHTTISKRTGKDENGKNTFDKSKVANTKLKGMVEAYKENVRAAKPQEKETISITTAKGLVSEPLQGKDGNEYRRVSIPNKDENDKSPWSTFVVKSDKVHENEKSVTIDLPKDGHTTVSKRMGRDENGKNTFDKSKVANTELKGMVEAYKTNEREVKPQEKETISITTAKGLVSEPLQGKDGNEYRRVSIPNKDENDKSPWSTFVVKSDKVHENEKSVTIDLPKDGHTTVSKRIGKDENGKSTFDNSKIANTELKGMVEAYKTNEREVKPQEKATFGRDKMKKVAKQVKEKPREHKENSKL